MKVCSICHRCYADRVVSCVETEHPELSETRTGNPDMIAGYELELLLESGLKGEVYRALRTDSQLSCLIKIVASNEENKQKFLQDAKTATTLFNQSIVDVYECGSLESGEVFVVAEDAAGQTVRELLNNVGVPQLLTTVQIVRQTAEAVHALHLSGLIHRSIRPENIILTTDAEHRLLVRIQNADLGGVAEHSIVSNKFLIDSALDSIRYFAPEQFSGEGASVKTDVYSLGIVFYEMLAGTPPFDAEKASGLIDMHRNQRPPDVTIDNFDLRMLLTHTLMESLQKQPGKRQSSANAFARQLRHIEQLATHSPTPPAAGTVAAPPPLANFAVASASAAPRVAAVEPPKVKPVIVTVEKEPVVSEVASEVISFRTEPDFLPISEIEIISDIELECAEEEFPEIPKPIVDQPIATNGKMESGPPKSRLKRLKKQLRSFTAATSDPSTTSVLATGEEGSNVAPQEVPVVTPVMAAVAASPIPRKVEWEQPEDDLLSLDDIPAALFSEPMPGAPVVLATQTIVPPPAVLSVPRKIEWEQPEDNIPNIEEAKVFASEQRLEEVSIDPTATESVMVAAESKAPRKIEWVQPEDDIPSLDETLDVVSREPISFAPTIEPAPIAAVPVPVQAAPRKIEWAQPDDDIPSIEEVMEIMATEQLVESSLDPVQKEIPAASPIVPKKIEWVQPDDDIPSMENVVLAQEQIPESAFALPTSEDEVVATPLIAPKKIDWVQPDDDIPSMEAVMEVLATEQISQSAVLPSIPEADITSMDEARDILPKMQTADLQPVHEQPEDIAIENSYNEPTPGVIDVMPVVPVQPEEITGVSPPRRIKIDWEQPKPWETLSKEIEYFPTLLGDVDTNRKTDSQSEQFFSDYYADEESRSSDHYRSLMIGSGFIALIVLFLFGNDSVWTYLQNGSSADSVAVKTTSSTQTFPQSAQTTTPNDQRVLKSFENPRRDEDVESGQSKPSAIKVSSSSADETSPAEKTPEPNKEPQKATSGRSAGKTPVVPSTLVISSDDGKISSKVEPQSKRSANKKQASSVSMESTRPRIVENPQP